MQRIIVHFTRDYSGFICYFKFVICSLIRIIPTLLQYMKWNISFSLCNISTQLYTTYQVPFMKLIAVLRKIKSRQTHTGNTSLFVLFSFLSWHSTIREWLSGSSKTWKHIYILLWFQTFRVLFSRISLIMSRFFFQQQTRNVSACLFQETEIVYMYLIQARNLQPKFRFNRITFYEKCSWCMKVQAGDCWICPGLLDTTAAAAAWWKMWRIIFFQEIDSNGDVAFSINTHNLCCINRKCVF